MAFTATKVEKMPKLVCTGMVSEVSEAKDTSKGVYAMIGVKIEGTRGSRGAYQNILFRPEWFDTGFDPESQRDLASEDDPEIGDKLVKQYGRTVASQSRMSVLQGLVGGTMDALNELSAHFEQYQASVLKGTTYTKEAVQEVLASFLTAQGAEIGYVLRQQTEKTDEVDQNGKPIYNLVAGYEVDTYFCVADNKAVERLVKQAQKNPDKIRIAFEMN